MQREFQIPAVWLPGTCLECVPGVQVTAGLYYLHNSVSSRHWLFGNNSIIKGTCPSNLDAVLQQKDTSFLVGLVFRFLLFNTGKIRQVWCVCGKGCLAHHGIFGFQPVISITNSLQKAVLHVLLHRILDSHRL